MSRTRGSTSAEPADAGAASTPSQNDAGGDFVVVNIPEELDHHHLAEILPEIPDLTTATPDVVLFLYELVAKQYALLDSSQRDLDELKAENERKDVELEQAFLEKESVSKESETSVISVQEELARVKQERDKLVEENNALKTQLSTVSSSQNATSTEVKALKHQVQDIEREKRDLMGVISRAKKEEETREEEIQSLRASLRAARQDHQTLESQIRELKSQEASTKFKLDSLTQQLKLAQTEAERTNAELSNKTEEYSKYRRAKHAEMLSLQSSHDSLSQEHTATQASLNALKSSHSTQTNQLSQALSKIQALTGQIAEQEARYADEANGLKRLIQTLEDRDRHQREVVEGIQSQWAAVGETSERRENSLKDKLEQEAKRREEAEKRVEQLENVLGKMSRGDLQMPGTPFRTPGTPGGLAMGEFNEAVLSPTVALASRSQRGGKTFTEVYTEYVGLQEENGQLRSKLADMDRTMTAVVAEIEERAPILAQQRIEYERVTREASQLSAQLNQTLQERDAQAKLATETNQKLTKSTAENGLLQQQLSDLGRQIQTLLREIARRDDPTIPIDEELENVPLAQANDVNAIITNNLVLFRNIESLQQQNQRLLRITRELGEKMESEEREYKAAMEQEQGEAIREAHEAMLELGAQLEAQKRSSDGIIQSYVKERDALKAMLRRAEAAAQQAGLNLNIGQQPVTQNTTVVSDSEIARELHEVQEQFEAYKMEMGVDSTRLRDELTSTQRQAHELGANLAKANAKIEFLNDRHRMHQEQFQLNSREFDELNKRNQNLFDQWTRADIECARVSDDLQVANGRLEQLRNECANLRAEKQIWQGVEARLLDENKTLAMERSHLSDLMSNIQKMHNDLERSGENDRRRLEGQLQMLEGQTQDLRTQLSRERDAVRQISMQKDLEARDLQSRLDRANSDLSKVRESLVGSETSKKHLEERVSELNKQQQGFQEKLNVYEQRPATTTAAPSTAANPDLTREQQLEQEVAELRSALKVAELDLVSAKSHVEQFKEISQANESALSDLNKTFEEYRTSTETQIARHEAEHKSLQDKLEAANNELTELRAQFEAAQKAFDEERTALKNDKKTLEETIVDMTTSEKNLENDRSFREHEVRNLEDRAKAAEERYSHEVVSHADSIKLVEQLRRDLSAAQAKVRECQTASDTAISKLTASEQSWSQQKDTLQREISDLKSRCDDLSSQNSTLHKHLESVSSQAARITQAAMDPSGSPSGEDDTSEDTETKLAELRKVISWLRNEKDIADKKDVVSQGEVARLKAHIERLSHSLEEARTTISEERERAIEGAASATQHAELLKRIDELNVLRDSNAHLRAECEIHAKKARELEAKLKKLSAELEPAKEHARNAQAELEATKGLAQRLEQESHGWQERNKQLLSKYDRTDPAEVQALKDEIAKLKSEVEAAQGSKVHFEQDLAAKQAALDEATRKVEAKQSSHDNFKDRAQKMIRDLQGQKVALTKEKNELEAKISELQASGEESKKPDPALASLREERDKLLAEKASWSAAQAAPSDASGNWEAEKVELVRARDEALNNLKVAQDAAQKAAEEARNIRMQNEKFQTRLVEGNKLRAGEQGRIDAAVAQAVEKTKSEIGYTPDSSTEELTKKHQAALENLRRELQTKHQAELKAAREAAAAAAAAAATAAQSQTTPADGAATEAALAEQKKQLEVAHAKEIESARESGRAEAQAKLKVKDSQLSKFTQKYKALEARVHEWEAAGILPANPFANLVPPPVVAKPTAAPAAAKPAAPTPAAAAARPTAPTAVAKPGVPAPAAVQKTGATSGTVKLGVPAGQPTAAPRPGVPVTRGGAPRGRVLPGGARAGPSRPLPTKAAPAAGGISIAGAAAAAAASSAAPKRPREEQEGAGSEDSLAKRLKPAETTAGNAATTAKPVQLRRPPPGT